MANSTGHLRISSSEMEDAVREEKKKWRIFRLQQVREQAKTEASRVRGAVHRRKKETIHSLGKGILQQWQDDKENQVRQLQHEYDECFRAFGKAHAEAREQPDAVEMLEENTAINRQKAARRGCEATKIQRELDAERDTHKNKLHNRKKSAIRKEKLRATRIAQLPMPKAFKKEKIIVPKPIPTVQLYEHGTLTTTNYAPKNVIVEKEIKSTKPSAHQLAEAEKNAYQTAIEEERNEAETMDRKREERGKSALRKERLHRMYRDMMEQLDQAQLDHHLSAFMGGADGSIYETEALKLKRLASHQEVMEAAVEIVLQENIPEASEETVIEGPEEASDLKEISEDSRLEAVSEDGTSKGKGLQELEEEMRKHRLHVNQVINDLDSTQEIEPEIIGTADTKMPEIHRDREIVSLPETSTDSEVDFQPESGMDKAKPAPQNELGESETYWRERENARKVPSQMMHSKKTEAKGPTDDIHLTETVPVHLMPANWKYRRIPVKDTGMTSKSTSERTVLPGSSDDIEVRIHLSSDSSSQSPVLPHEYSRCRIPEHTSQVSRYPGGVFYPGDNSSTEYLSLPSFSCPAAGNEAHVHNLKEIRQRRQNIQTFLDGQDPSVHQEIGSPVTYMQEMNSGGSGTRPLSRRGKFELKKRELLKHYIKKLLSLRNEELMQISASTVEGSGLSVSSLWMLLDSLNKADEDSVFSALANLTESSSSELASPAAYPDIDEVPTKLTRNPTLLPHIPKIYPQCRPEIFTPGNSDVNMDSSSSPGFDQRNPLVHNIHGGIHKPESSPPYPDTHFPPFRIQEFPQALPNPPVSTEESSTIESSFSDFRFKEANVEREVKILQDLKMLQRLKQELLLKKNSLLKDSEADMHPRKLDERGNAPTATLNETEPPSASTMENEKPSEHIYRYVYPHSSKNLTSDSRTSVYQREQEVTSEREGSTTKIPTIPIREVPSNAKEVRDSIDSDNFMALKPEQSYGSTLTSSIANIHKNVHRKPEDVYSLSGTTDKFKHLIPEGTLHSDRMSTKGQTSCTLGVPTSSSKPKNTGDSKNTVDFAGYRDSLFPDELKQGLNENLYQVGSAKHDERTSEIVVLPAREEEITSSSDMPRDSSLDQISTSNQYKSRDNSSRSSSKASNLQKSSSESVTSIPDMAEILQKFGLNWATSMIRKMDKAEEHTSSGN